MCDGPTGKKKRRTFSLAPTPSASARLSIFRRHREFSQAKNLRYMFPGGNNYFHESSCQEITIFHGGLHSTLTKIGFHDGICSTSTKNTNFMRVCFKLSRKIHPLTKSRFCGSDTGQIGPSDRSDRSQQNRGAAHSAPKGATRQNSSLGVSLHHFPPLCISTDKFNTSGAEIHIRVSWNKLDRNKP